MPSGVYVRTEEHRRRISETMTGRSYSEERKRNISKGRKGKCTGSDHPCWRGGVSRIQTNKRRNMELIEIFRAGIPNGIVGCYFCGEEIMKFEGMARDALAIHSLDGNHENWDSINKVPAHLGCHSSFHNRGEKNYHWQGDAASDKAKRRRTS